MCFKEVEVYIVLEVSCPFQIWTNQKFYDAMHFVSK